MYFRISGLPSPFTIDVWEITSWKQVLKIVGWSMCIILASARFRQQKFPPLLRTMKGMQIIKIKPTKISMQYFAKLKNKGKPVPMNFNSITLRGLFKNNNLRYIFTETDVFSINFIPTTRADGFVLCFFVNSFLCYSPRHCMQSSLVKIRGYVISVVICVNILVWSYGPPSSPFFLIFKFSLGCHFWFILQ